MGAQSVAAGLAWSVGSFGLRGVFALVSLAWLARLLGPRDFGIATVMVVSSTLLAFGAQLGYGAALVQAEALNRRVISAAFRRTVIAGTAGSALFLLVGAIVSWWLQEEILAALSICATAVWFLVVASVPEMLLHRQGRFRELAIVEVMAHATGPVTIAIWMAHILENHHAILLGFAASATLRALWLLYLSRGSGLSAPPSFAELESLRHFSCWYSVSRVLSYAGKEADNLVIGIRAGVGTVGVYSRGYVMAAMPPNYIGAAVERVYFPVFARQHHGRAEPFEGMYSAMELVMSIGVVVAITGSVYAGPLVDILLGDGWSAVVPVFAVLVWGTPWRLAYKFGDALAKATGSVKRRAVRESLVLGVLLAGCWLVAPRGPVAISGLVVMTVGLNFLLAFWQAASEADVPVARVFQLHLRPLAVGIPVVTIAIALRFVLPSPSLVGDLAGLGLATVIGVLIAFLACSSTHRAHGQV